MGGSKRPASTNNYTDRPHCGVALNYKHARVVVFVVGVVGPANCCAASETQWIKYRSSPAHVPAADNAKLHAVDVCMCPRLSVLSPTASNKNNHNPAGQLRRSSRNLYQAIAVLNRAVLPAHMDVPLWESRVGALCSVYCLSRAHIGFVVGVVAWPSSLQN